METEMTTGSDPSPAPARLPNRRRWWAGIGALLAAGALSLSVAQAHGPGDGGGAGGDGPWQGAGPSGGFAGHRMGRLLERVGATDGQKAQIKAIWDGLRPQLKPLHEQHAQLRQQIGQAMAAFTIDGAQVEKLRQQSVQLIDRTSVLMTQGMVASANVLTPDQRRQVLAEMQKHHGHGGDVAR